MTDRPWWKDGIVYQIYPRSFQDSNNDGIGDLPGILSRLDYIQSLGVDAIWLCPVNPSPDIDFGYDVSDYYAINPKFGSMEDFDNLLSEVHHRNLHLILDLVLNHTSDQHPWFQESKKSKDNPYHDWYLWRDPAAKGGVPNNWQSWFAGKGWEYDQNLNQYYFHMFHKEQPDLNWRNAGVRAEMLNIFKFWLDRGVDGFRLDVFNEYFKDAEFRNNPRAKGYHLRAFFNYQHIYDVSQPEMIPALQEIRALIDRYENRYLVGETFLASPQQARGYIGPDRLHAGFDFSFLNSGFNAQDFRKAIAQWDGLHGEDAWPNYVLNNHDNPRSASRYTYDENDARLKLLAALLLTLRGTPFLYYGEEIGMRDIQVNPLMMQDMVGKRHWPWHSGRDGCRAPMQWHGGKNAGFSLAEPWLPVNADYVLRNVENQQQGRSSLLNFYKELIELRKSSPPLYQGSLKLLSSAHETVLMYQRQDGTDKFLVVLNFSNLRVTQLLPLQEGSAWKVCATGNEAITSYLYEQTLTLPPYGLAILKAVIC